jgi:hypothetical protein
VAKVCEFSPCHTSQFAFAKLINRCVFVIL